MVSAVSETKLTLLDNLTLQYKAIQADAIYAQAAMHQKTYTMILPSQFGKSLPTKYSDNLVITYLGVVSEIKKNPTLKTLEY